VKTKDFNILFSGLSVGTHHFDFELNDTFFELFGYTDYTGLQGNARMTMLKSETVFDLDFTFKGSIQALCDIMNELFTQELENSFSIQVKFGEEYNDENEELLVLPHSEHTLKIAQNIYELVVLSIPSKLLGPNAGNGLEDFIEEKEETLKEAESDPRWDQLKNLLNNK